MTTLIKFKSDWDDEFEAEDYFILEEYTVSETEDAIEAFLVSDVYRHDMENMLYFGTNEGFADITLDHFELIEIDKFEAEVLYKLLGPSFGTGVAAVVGSEILWANSDEDGSYEFEYNVGNVDPYDAFMEARRGE